MQSPLKTNPIGSQKKNSSKSLIQINFRQYSMIIALVFIMVFFQITTDGLLLKPLNITNLILQNSYILVLAVGMLLVIVTGHIDLSVGSVAAFVGAISAIMMVNYEMSPFLAIVISLVLGAVIGAWQGFWIAYVRIPAFIVTLAGMLLFRGLTMIVLEGKSIAPFPESFQKISSGFIPDLTSGGSLHLLTILIGIALSIVIIFFQWKNRRNQLKHQFEVQPFGLFVLKLVGMIVILNIFTFVLATYEGIPNILIVLGVLIVIYTFVTNKTKAGRHIYAIGGNEKAALLSGIKTKKMTFMVFVNMGVLSALSGLLFAARLNAATPKAGNLFELDAIAACFIGGASAYGGIGTIPGAIIGGLVMGIMNNGMSLMGLGVDWQQGIKGLVLLAAVAFDIYNKNKAQ
ncbi:MAG: sugar ABC transporter permease [Bacillus sp. (in: Bacteria)]|uniref:Xylose transport system permease protein XylH n=1 Tax=Niallia alba TaxID=2729105 RepID=A0A7Y0K7C8_9BACI|nr:multiple monosaccharide ABC transporter permease [Niallia alba]MBQ6449008.1 sugar ABC transporter permease [Bacillus sp. (in: firmicutes)]NMO76858.1 sugar ABC transporter permease [Niallia alba]